MASLWRQLNQTKLQFPAQVKVQLLMLSTQLQLASSEQATKEETTSEQLARILDALPLLSRILLVQRCIKEPLLHQIESFISESLLIRMLIIRCSTRISLLHLPSKILIQVVGQETLHQETTAMFKSHSWQKQIKLSSYLRWMVWQVPQSAHILRLLVLKKVVQVSKLLS